MQQKEENREKQAHGRERNTSRKDNAAEYQQRSKEIHKRRCPPTAIHALSSLALSSFCPKMIRRSKKLICRVFTFSKMPQLLLNSITLVLVVSLTPLITCRPTEGESFKRQTLPDSLPFSDGFLDPQILSEPGSINLGGANLAFLNDIAETSPSSSTLFSDLSTFSIAVNTLCPGAFRYPYCCGINGCTQTTSCLPGEILNCCTAEPNLLD